MAGKDKKEFKPATITYEDGLEYTLEFNRKTVSDCEKAGFDSDLLDKMPMTQMPLLFHYAFKMHHPTISKQRTDEILFDDLGGLSTGLANRLVELYNAALSTLIAEEKEPKNAKAKVVL